MMAKGVNDGKPKRSHSYKPYDTSNSFVKRVASRVSELLPQPISRWFSPTVKEPVHTGHDRHDLEDDEGQRPSKRLRLNQTFNDYTHINNVGRLSSHRPEDADVSPILPNPLDEYAIPGPSGLHLRKTTDNFISSTPAVPPTSHIPEVEKTNDACDDGSDSSDSTSGCSSLVPQSDKTSSFSAIRTLHTNENPNVSTTSSIGNTSRNQRSLFPRAKYPRVDFSNSSSRGMPVFDPVIFHSPFKSGSANSSFKDDVSNASPFYRGRTMYGGASSCKEALSFPSSPIRPQVPRIINIRPEQSVTVRDSMGETAKKILEALEKFSTPVMDAKRIPVKQSNSTSLKRKLPQPYQELSIPQMPDLLRIKRRESQQRNRSAAMPETVASTSQQSGPPPPKKPSEDLSLRSDNESINTKKKEAEFEEPEPELFMPNIALPITTLPVIDISLPPASKPPKPEPTVPISTSPISPVTISTITTISSKPSPITVSSPPRSSFKFSEPITQPVKISLEPGSQPPASFKFSFPLNPKEAAKKHFSTTSLQTDNSSKPEPPIGDTAQSTSILSTIMKSGTSNFKLKRKQSNNRDQEEEGKPSVMKAVSELKSGIVSNVLNFKGLENSNSVKISDVSKCQRCNKSIEKDKIKCSGCETYAETQKDVNSGYEKNSLSSTEKKGCSVCSSGSDCKCDNGQVKGVKKDDSAKSTKEKVKTDGFGTMFKAPVDTWECKVCLVRNKSSETSCVACVTPKEGASAPKPLPQLNAVFKKADGMWECGTCLVQNKSGTDACVACSTPRPGASNSTKENAKPTFSFGIPPSLQSSEQKSGGISFAFGNGTAKDDVKMPSTGFSFGVEKAESKNETGLSSTFKFGSNEKSTEGSKVTFTFGNVENLNKDEEKPNKILPNATTGTTAAVATPVNYNFTSTPVNESNNFKANIASEDKEEQPNRKRVSFGEPLTEERTISSDTKSSMPSSNFTFGNPHTSKNETQPSDFTFQPKPTSIFGNTSTVPSTTSLPTTPIFKFGASTKSNTKTETALSEIPKTTVPTFSFTGSTTTAFPSQDKSEKSKPLFGFLSEKPKVSNTETPIFNSSAVESKDSNFESIQPPVNKPLLPINSNANETSSIFGSATETKQNLFGNEEKKVNFFGSADSTKPSFFNSNIMNDNNKGVFGGPQADSWGVKPNFNTTVEPAHTFNPPPTTTSSTFSGFGTATPSFSNSEITTPAFTFNAVQNQAPSTNIFAFKSEPENKSQGFSFGGTATTKPSSGGFTFSMPQTTAPNSFQTPSFSTTPAVPNPTPTVFGGTSSVFGAPSPSPFAFGAPQQQEQPPAAPAVFAFSSGQPQTTAAPNAPSFSFGSQNASAPAPTPSFDPNIRPSFNFTGGTTPSFSATPGGEMQQPMLKHTDRKIRRAVRRSTQNR